MLEVKNISKRWSGAEVLKQTSLTLEEGRSVGLMGPSGSGKSTLARIILFLETADTGDIYYRGERVGGRNKLAMKRYRREVQYISQHPESFFDPNWKLGQSVIEAARIHHLPSRDTDDKIRRLLRDLQLNEAVLNRYPHQVSGGEIQRAALCRALLLDPKVLILDEATSMLDISVQAQILNLLKNIQRERGLSCLLISHDAEVVRWFADSALELKML